MADVRNAPRTAPPPHPAPTAPVAVETSGVLRTPRLLLRPLTEHDRAAYLSLVDDNRAELDGRIPLCEPGESDDAFFGRQLEACRAGDADHGCCRRVAELAGEIGECNAGAGRPGTLVGCFNLNAIQRGLAWEADAAWWIGARFTGLGLATEGVRALLGYAFEAMPAGLGLHGVHCGIEASNAASIRIAEKCGFEHRPGAQSYLKVGQRWVNHEFYMATPDSIASRAG